MAGLTRHKEVTWGSADSDSRAPVLLSAQMTSRLISRRLIPVLIATVDGQCVLNELLVLTADLIAITAEVMNRQVGCLRVWCRGHTSMLTPLIKE